MMDLEGEDRLIAAAPVAEREGEEGALEPAAGAPPPALGGEPAPFADELDDEGAAVEVLEEDLEADADDDPGEPEPPETVH